MHRLPPLKLWVLISIRVRCTTLQPGSHRPALGIRVVSPRLLVWYSWPLGFFYFSNKKIRGVTSTRLPDYLFAPGRFARKVSRFAPLNRYYDRWKLFRQFLGIIYLLVVCKKNNNSFMLVYFNYLCIKLYTKKIIIHSFWSTFVKDLKRNFSCKIYKKPHKNSKKPKGCFFIVSTQKCMKWLRCCTSAQITSHHTVCIVQRNFTHLIRCQTMKVNKEILHI